MQLRTIIFFNRTTSNLDGTISYVHESNTTFERVTAKPLDRKSCSSLRSRGVFPLRCSNAQYHQTTGAVNLILAHIFQIWYCIYIAYMGVRRNFSRGSTSTFCLSFSGCWRFNANGSSQTVYCFYTTKKMPQESTRSIRIHFEILFKWRCTLFCRKGVLSVTVSDFAELAHKYRIAIVVNSRLLSLNKTWTISDCLRFSHLSVLVEQNSLLKSFV